MRVDRRPPPRRGLARASSARPSRRAAPRSPRTCSRRRARCRPSRTPITSSCSAPSRSVYDDGPARAWIEEELAWLRRADEAGVPVLGICFGAQALCAALGGRVEPAARKEVGWTMIDSYDPALIPPGPWLEFHDDRCLPPPRAKILARNELGGAGVHDRAAPGGAVPPRGRRRPAAAVAGRGRARGGRAGRAGPGRAARRDHGPGARPPRSAPTRWSRPRSCWPRAATPRNLPPCGERGFVVTKGWQGSLSDHKPQ